VVSFLEPPETSSSEVFPPIDFTELSLVSRAVKVATGKGCFSVITQPFVSQPLILPASRYCQDIINIWDFFRTPDIADVTFVLPDKREVLAHKAILTCRSPLMAAVFQAEPESPPDLASYLVFREVSDSGQSVYQVKNWASAAFITALHFVYTNQVPPLDKPRRQELAEILAALEVSGYSGASQPTELLHVPLLALCPLEKAMADVHADVKITLEDGSFMVSRAMLVARSPYFEAMLGPGCHWRETSQMPCLVSLKHLTRSVFRIVLKHVYSDSVDIFADLDRGKEAPTQSRRLKFAIEVLAVTNELLFDHLKDACQVEISRLVDLRNVCEIYGVADLFEAPDLKRFCQEFIMGNLEHLLEARALESLEERLFKDLDRALQAQVLPHHISDTLCAAALAIADIARDPSSPSKTEQRRRRRRRPASSFSSQSSVSGESGSEYSDAESQHATDSESDGETPAIPDSPASIRRKAPSLKQPAPQEQPISELSKALKYSKLEAPSPSKGSPRKQKGSAIDAPNLIPVQELPKVQSLVGKGVAPFMEPKTGGSWFVFQPETVEASKTQTTSP